MKNKILRTTGIIVGSLLLGAINFFNNTVLAETQPDNEKYEIYGENGEFLYPDNTKCTILDKTTREPSTANKDITFYQMCLGSFPKYASTKVEEGLMPVYYAKYYFYPDPMPVYQETSDGLIDSLGNNTAKETYTRGNKVDGLAFKVSPILSFEKKDEPSYRGIYYLYPYNSEHNLTNPHIKGPYQIGYNSFYHNTYRSRNFAYSTTFDFKIYEPVQGVTTDGKENSKIFFEGKIVYEMDSSCFNEDYLVYSDHCQAIEFYFPKGDVLDKSSKNKDKATAYDGAMVNVYTENSFSPTGEETNAVPSDRVYYRNPGTHTIDLIATENLALRTQKDIGTEYQTKGNPSSVQNVNSIDDTIYYFERTDLDLHGNIILAKNTILRVVSELYREGDGKNPAGEITLHNGKVAVSATTISNEDTYTITSFNPTLGSFEYDSYTKFLNYCTMNTDAYGATTNSRKFYTGTSFLLDPLEQKESACYHNHSRENHFWQYDWSRPAWINK